MTTENQNTPLPKTETTNSASNHNTRMDSSTKLEEIKGNALKPLSLRPNRSVKKNSSLKPLGLGLRNR